MVKCCKVIWEISFLQRLNVDGMGRRESPVLGWGFFVGGRAITEIILKIRHILLLWLVKTDRLNKLHPATF
jgi:hypothetical protein